QVVVEWNRGPVEIGDAGLCVHEQFGEQARKTPKAAAVIYEGQTLSYAELNRRANQLARHLRKLGVGPEVCVGIWMERSVELMVAVLGVLKAGGAYVGMDAALPLARLEYIVADSHIEVLLTQEKLIEELRLEVKEIVCLDRDWEELGQMNARAVRSGVGR